ncbi:NAD(P)/FAD-dependent oxidoreductase [Jatrophihabitans sp.]|uniref:NAD(P)/FAD-dependent oxidoreductase n=1 Tax=Jatrophihabitans sp. TaxID=1932789 RepID=UPI002BC39580|nr:NAD(P)/FAD-dependent oxidoreductase [Jatrophihabitans sp.]
MNTYDVVVIGGGAAGLSAAMVLSRAGRQVLVVDAGQPRNAPATHMHGYLSRDGMPPAELLAAGRQEVEGYGGRFCPGAVVAVVREDGWFRLDTSDAPAVRARRILVATGLRDELPDVDGLRERWARDVLHCPYCHGYEVRGQAFGVLGWSPEAVRYAQIVRQWSDDVVLFVAPGSLSADDREQLTARAVGIVEGEVSRLVVQDDALRAVALGDGRTVARDVVFVPPRFVPNNEVFTGLGCDIAENGWVVTDDTGRTTAPGVWAAGNVRNPRAQVITAAGEGSTAAIAINADLVDEDVRHAVHEHRGASRR